MHDDASETRGTAGRTAAEIPNGVPSVRIAILRPRQGRFFILFYYFCRKINFGTDRRRFGTDRTESSITRATRISPRTRTGKLALTLYGIQFQGTGTQMAAALAGARNLPRRSRPRTSEILRSRHVPLPVGRRPARRPSAGLYRLGHLLALQTPERLQRPAPDGIRRLRPARRAVRHTDRPAPRRDDRAEHRPLPRAARQDRVLVRLGSRGAHLRPRLLQMDAVGVPQDVRLLLLL